MGYSNIAAPHRTLREAGSILFPSTTSSSQPKIISKNGQIPNKSTERGSGPDALEPEYAEQLGTNVTKARHGYGSVSAPTLSPQQLAELEVVYDYSDDYVDEELHLGDNGVAPPVALPPRPLLQPLEWAIHTAQ